MQIHINICKNVEKYIKKNSYAAAAALPPKNVSRYQDGFKVDIFSNCLASFSFFHDFGNIQNNDGR